MTVYIKYRICWLTCWQGWSGDKVEGGEYRARGNFQGVREMLVIVTVVMVSRVHTYVITDQIIHFKYVYFNKAGVGEQSYNTLSSVCCSFRKLQGKHSMVIRKRLELKT